MQRNLSISQIQINFPQNAGNGPGMTSQFPVTALQITQVVDGNGTSMWQNQSQTALIDADFTPEFLAQTNALLATVGLVLGKL